jgi:ATP-dependent Clp protease ATP-binding subunit ClpA
VRKRPYSVVLLDEVEKAHRDVMNLFYQVFDRGFMRDGEGREIDFRNTVILMTSNLGSDHLMQLLDEQPEASEAICTNCCDPARSLPARAAGPLPDRDLPPARKPPCAPSWK